MATCKITTHVDIKDVLGCVAGNEEEDVLLEVLEKFAVHNVNAALREYFRSQKERGAALPDFVDAEKL